MKTEVKVVIGANYGDEGKGLMTDFFCADSFLRVLNVRFNGGGQAGHTVELTDGVKHVFKHFGSGSFADADTYLTEDFIINPIVFRKELQELQKLGLRPKVFYSPKARITHYTDMMINQIVEISRGKGNHGSCGVGIFETITRYKEGREGSAYYAFSRLKELGLEHVDIESSLMLTNSAIDNVYKEDLEFFLNYATAIEPEEIYSRYRLIVFEGAQGLRLDMDNKKDFPHLTPSKTGIHNAVKEINRIKEEKEIEFCYVTRSYITRHGAGPFEEETNKEEVVGDYEDLTNFTNPYQGGLRYGHFDKDIFFDYVFDDMRSSRVEGKSVYYFSIAVTHLNLTNGLLSNGKMRPEELFGVSALNIKYLYKSDGRTRMSVVRDDGFVR